LCLSVVVGVGILFLLDSTLHYFFGFSVLDKLEKFLFDKFGD
jgi:hypothetical protein